MPDCIDPFIDCEQDKKPINWEQLFRLLVTIDTNSNPALRTCGQGGGGGGLTSLPLGNFVFVNPLGNDATGLRERFDLPFLTLNAAKIAAQAGSEPSAIWCRRSFRWQGY